MIDRYGTRAEGPIVLAVLAAGGSRRLGTPKQLLPYHGRPLLEVIASVACEAPVARVAVVLGARAPEIATCVSSLKVDVLVNETWQVGMATSVRCATWWALTNDAAALLLVAGDQPHLGAAHLRALLAAHRASGGAVASFYEGVRGVPALFPRAFFPRLLELRGDRGAGVLLREAPVAEVPWAAGAFDVDELSDVARLGSA